jgi:hypothetical protein
MHPLPFLGVRVLVVLPLVLFAVALVPTMVVLPFLPARRSARVLRVIKELHAWHIDLVACQARPSQQDGG